MNDYDNCHKANKTVNITGDEGTNIVLNIKLPCIGTNREEAR